MHPEQNLSHRLLITAASTDTTSVRLILSKLKVQTGEHRPQNNPRWTSEGIRRLGNRLNLFFTAVRQVCLLWYFLHSSTDVLIYLWIWWGNLQGIQVQPASTQPCHICIYLMAHNSPSPGLTQSIKSTQLTSNSPFWDLPKCPSLALSRPAPKTVPS